MTDKQPRTAFISGPLEVSTAYFDRYYKSRIDTAIAAGDYFVVGPVSGIDALALAYLLHHPDVSRSRIHVYMAGFEVSARPIFVDEMKRMTVLVVEVPDAMTTWDRDAAMTRASEYDILRYRTEWEQKAMFQERWRPRVSNTERNERRRLRLDPERSNRNNTVADSHEGDGAGNEGEVDERYIRHVGGLLEKKFRDWTLQKTSRMDGHETETCDGTCDGHRDVVYKPLVIGGNSAFGAGNDGLRKM